MTDNPFATEAAWEPTDAILPAGEHLVEIREADGSGESSGGHPQLVVKAGNADGSITDWIVVILQTVGKVVALTDAAGLERPGDDDVQAEGTGYRISGTYVGKLIGKKIGVVIHEEPDYNDPTRTRTRVKGWVHPSKIQGTSDVPGSREPTQVAGHTFKSAIADDDVPF